MVIMEWNKLLVVACPRSGTRHINAVLNSHNIRTAHEREGEQGTVNWMFSVPYHKNGEPIELKKYDLILHQIRNPLNVVKSFPTIHPVAVKRLSQIAPITDEDSRLLVGMKAWYYCNLRCEKLAEWSYRIEDLTKRGDIYLEFCDRLGITPLNSIKVGGTNTRVHNDKYLKHVTWMDFFNEDRQLTEQILELAAKYGYVDKEN